MKFASSVIMSITLLAQAWTVPAQILPVITTLLPVTTLVPATTQLPITTLIPTTMMPTALLPAATTTIIITHTPAKTHSTHTTTHTRSHRTTRNRHGKSHTKTHTTTHTTTRSHGSDRSHPAPSLHKRHVPSKPAQSHVPEAHPTSKEPSQVHKGDAALLNPTFSSTLALVLALFLTGA
ncbi:hypothetical protein NUW58_g6563 [Xylaria curta]|uniref:Uncharacterized protein n=1 Tax=Xylaria curta TaxID=42375 RepID=A0ACC1NTX0_9PEZI|nr:hypothetical protein NUW58_g6563 [Xylaria curta]